MTEVKVLCPQVRSIYERYKEKIPGLIEIRDENVGITPLMVRTNRSLDTHSLFSLDTLA